MAKTPYQDPHVCLKYITDIVPADCNQISAFFGQKKKKHTTLKYSLNCAALGL